MGEIGKLLASVSSYNCIAVLFGGCILYCNCVEIERDNEQQQLCAPVTAHNLSDNLANILNL